MANIVLETPNSLMKIPIKILVTKDKIEEVAPHRKVTWQNKFWQVMRGKKDLILFIIVISISLLLIYFIKNKIKRNLKKISKITIEVSGPINYSKSFTNCIINIGRSDENEIILDAPPYSDIVSRKHGKIDFSDGRLLFGDFSSHGTLLNGKTVKKAVLKYNDLLEIGRFKIKISETE